MKISSMLAGFIYGFLSMMFIPFLLMKLNDYFKLPNFTDNYVQILGAFSIISGVLLGMYAIGLFAKYGNGGSPLPFDPPHKLVTVGAYKYIRNPMFTASALVWFGEFFFFGSFLLLFYAIGWVLFNHIHLVAQDEKWLEKRFGKEYLRYKKKTPRYLPRLL